MILYIAQRGKNGRIRFASLTASSRLHTLMIPLPPPGTVIYADPPYVNTTGFGMTGKFNPYEFWLWGRRMQEYGCLVFVSEQMAPPDWVPAASFRRGRKGFAGGLSDHLFVHESSPMGRDVVRPVAAVVTRGDERDQCAEAIKKLVLPRGLDSR